MKRKDKVSLTLREGIVGSECLDERWMTLSSVDMTGPPISKIETVSKQNNLTELA